MRGRRSRTAAFAIWTYARLLRVLPRGFREEYGADSAELFADRVMGAVSDGGVWTVPGVLVRAVRDLLVQSVVLRLEARRRSGAGAREDTGAGNGRRYLAGYRTDIAHALRQHARSPAFGLLVVGTIAAGVGVNTAMFSVANGVLLRPLPYPAADELVMVLERHDDRGWSQYPVSPANYLDWRERTGSVVSLAAYTTGTATLLGGGEPERLDVLFVEPQLLTVLRVDPVLGRPFTSVESEEGGGDAVLLGHRLWADRFGSDSTMIGRSVSIGGRDLRVAGVLPADLTFGGDADVWRPLIFNPGLAAVRGAHFMNVVGRLSGGTTVEGARTAMETIAAAMAVEYPETNAGWSATVVPLREQIVGPVRDSVIVLLGAVGLVLLVTCMNVANLLIARGTRRIEEFSVRGALGAGPVRLARQVVTESVVLALTGAVAGALLAAALLRLLVHLAPSGLPRIENVKLDGTVLAFCAGLSLLVGLVVGLLPALAASRTGAADWMRGNRVAGGSPAARRLRRSLLVCEVALSVVLMVGFVMLGRNLLRLQEVDTGFRPAGLVAARMSPPTARYPEAADRARFYDDVADLLRESAGIESVGVTTRLPFTGSMTFGFRPADDTETPPGDWPSGELRAVDSAYFSTLGARLVRGRPFRSADAAGSPPVVIVNETLARSYLGGRDPIGMRIDVASADAACPCEIIGVVSDVLEVDLDRAPRPVYYLPQSQSIWTERSIVVRSAVPLAGTVDILRAAVRVVDREVPLYDIQPVDDLIDAQIASPRFRLTVFGLFAALALALAALGIYSVMSFVVSQRRRELGVRSALGARVTGLIWSIERDALGITAVGIVIGLAASVLAMRLLTLAVFGVEPLDAGVVALVAGVVTLVGATAALVPAWQAGRTSPVRAMRED